MRVLSDGGPRNESAAAALSESRYPRRASNTRPQDLLDQVSTKASAEHVRLYINHRLAAVVSRAESLVGEMKLDCVRKGVTYETLASGDLQQMVRDALPCEDWTDKPFAESDVAAAVQQVLPLS